MMQRKHLCPNRLYSLRPGRSGPTYEFILALYVVCYFLVGLSFLTDFPFVHSDEAWLSGLSRNMLESGDFGVTETFYDLKPRYPHAIKIIFHLLQIAMLSVFGYHVFTFRLLSLIFSCIALLLFYFVLKTIFCKPEAREFSNSGATSRIVCPAFYPLAGTILLSTDIQFIYAGHFARQEILLVCSLIACLLALLKKRPLAAGLITGLSIGLHPNSFLVGMMCVAMLFPIGWKRPKFPTSLQDQDSGSGLEPGKWLSRWKPLLAYTGITSAFALLFVTISLTFDRAFFRHYLAYGNSEFDITAPVANKLLELPYFLTKIWHGVSGTYYVPDVKFQFILFGFASVSLLIMLMADKMGRRKRADFDKVENICHCPASAFYETPDICHKAETLLIGRGIAGMLAGMVLIGRYNQTSIVFLFPLCFLLVLLVLDSAAHMLFVRTSNTLSGTDDKPRYAKDAARSFAAFALTIIIAAISVTQITPWLPFRYADYTSEIAKMIHPKDKVLANLNSEYYFENGKLLDYRNLSFLKEAGLSIEEYVRQNQIEYIILSDEMDLIYSQRPLWNMIYGNPRYMEELHRFLEQHGTLQHQFKDNIYGIRIVQYINSDRDFTVKIFKIELPSSSL